PSPRRGTRPCGCGTGSEDAGTPLSREPPRQGVVRDPSGLAPQPRMPGPSSGSRGCSTRPPRTDARRPPATSAGTPRVARGSRPAFPRVPSVARRGPGTRADAWGGESWTSAPRRRASGIRQPQAAARNTFKYRAGFAATMALLHSLLKMLDRVSPAEVAYAHCDIPCGIYDPHHAQMAAHTVIRMVDLIGQLEKPGPNATGEQRQEFMNKLARYTATKEQHAEIYKNELRVLWGDYFKPEHVQQFPQLHDLVWKSMKAGSKGRQEINLLAAEEMLKDANEIA